ncbi:MAG: hypothetical protein M3032_02020 [Verrucomicrobiota bacterium]|nr:hypothetical protein [Verrucomicrobiota bacterium]
MKQIAENVWTLRYPLPVLGHDFGRNVSVVRLHDGRLVIHSTAPFTALDVAAIRGLGNPGWILDATLFHDSFARQGCRAFERLPYLAPPGGKTVAEAPTRPLTPPPPEWSGELDVFPLAGMPQVREHVMYHRPSRTLIVCDFFFNLGPRPATFTESVWRFVMRLRNGIGMSAFFRFLIRDRAAFVESLRPILALDFERIIVGHGDIIEDNAKEVFVRELAARGLTPG